MIISKENDRKSPKIGEVYTGKVIKIVPFGAFVDFGFEKDGLVHISEIAEERIPSVESVLSMDQEVDVRFIGVDDRGRFKLSIRRAFPRVNDEA